MEISRNLSKQPFSTSSGRITLKNCLKDCFHLLKSPGCRFLYVLVLLRQFLVCHMFMSYESDIFQTPENGLNFVNVAKIAHKIAKSKYFVDI